MHIIFFVGRGTHQDKRCRACELNMGISINTLIIKTRKRQFLICGGVEK